jgi:hypothetical protein
MAMSMGQHKADGHSHGTLGHGGMHQVSAHMNSMSKGHTSEVHAHDPGGHTPSMEHGGDFNVGCC